MSQLFQFNLNNTIKVKLNDRAYQHLADLHNNYIGVIKNWETRDLNFYKNRADQHGYSSFQLWNFMEIFGPVTGLGLPQYYDHDILIDSKYLTPKLK